MSKNKFKVEDSIPAPEVLPQTPLNDLEVGQSFLFPRDQRNRIQSGASHIKKRSGKTFRVAVVDKTNCRIWRIS